VFDIKDVEYAILETNGKISVMLKPEKRPATPEVLNIKVEDTGMPFVVAYDGKIIDDNFKECNLSMEKFNSIINNKRVRIKEILLMTVDKSGEATIIKKEKPEK
ncbi:MAG: DUF421 domain-containing protein, partial [Clostridiales bacterium]|nr:DUF421 domain-containing protein [Clostridiales bacterium]